MLVIGGKGYDCYGREYRIFSRLLHPFNRCNLLAQHIDTEDVCHQFVVDENGEDIEGKKVIFESNPCS